MELEETKRQLVEAFKTSDGIDWFFDDFMVRTGALEGLKGPHGLKVYTDIMEIAEEAGTNQSEIANRLIQNMTGDAHRQAEFLEIKRMHSSGEFTQEMKDNLSGKTAREERLKQPPPPNRSGGWFDANRSRLGALDLPAKFRTKEGIDWFFNEFIPESGLRESLIGDNWQSDFSEIMDYAKTANADLDDIRNRLTPLIGKNRMMEAAKADVAAYIKSGQLARDYASVSPTKEGSALDTYAKAVEQNITSPVPEPKPWWKIW